MAQQKAADPAIVEEVDDLIDELQPGAKLLKGQYTITRYLNSGGFGITYLAKDSLDRDVVIKECFPSSFCRRSKAVVAARSRAHTAELRSIVQLFVREARSLAKIVHPNIVAVHQVFEDNGTAYMAIDFIDGLDLQQVIDGEGPRLTPDQIVHITDKLLVAVGFIHDNDMLHRDISPDNVLIDKAGEPILIDFGAAREQASNTSRAMSALRVVKDGYSPQEFYIAGSEQGPWSDLYALAATLFHLITGEAPVNGQARLAALAEDRADPYVPLTGRFEGYPAGFLEAIDRAMNTLPKHRLQSAKAWLAMFKGGADGSAPDYVAAAVHQLVEASRSPAPEPVSKAATPAPLASAASRSPAPDTAPAGSKSPMKLVAGVAVALIAAGAGYVMLGGDPAPTAEDTVSTTVTASDTAPAEAPAADVAETPGTGVAEAITVAEPAVTGTTEPESTPDTPAAEVSAEAAAEPAEDVAAETAPVEPAVESEDTTEVAAEPAPETTETTAAEETAVEAPADEAPPVATAEALPPAPEGKPSANQIGFAAWDIIMPFTTDDRMVAGQRAAVITRIPPSINSAEAGDWIAPGIAVHAVNAAPIESAGTLTVAVMNAMKVDPDGKARVVVEYSAADGVRQSGLLTVGAVRLVNLVNGVGMTSSVVDGAWRTEITGVAQPELTTLRQGDVLFRDKTTGIPLDSSTAIETILTDLIAKGVTQTEFAIVRDNKVVPAIMQLALEEGE